MRRRVKVGKEFDFSVSVDDKAPGPGKPKPKKAPRRVAVGQEFDAKITLSGSWADANDAITRTYIVWAVFAVCAAFLFGGAVLGLFTGEFTALQSSWGVIGPVYGGIAGYYFSRHEKK